MAILLFSENSLGCAKRNSQRSTSGMSIAFERPPMIESRFVQRDGAACCVLVQHSESPTGYICTYTYSPSLEKRNYKASQDDFRIRRPARPRCEGDRQIFARSSGGREQVRLASAARDRYRRSSSILRHVHVVDNGDRRHDGSQQILATIDAEMTLGIVSPITCVLNN
jgi:hypothetical protein